MRKARSASSTAVEVMQPVVRDSTSVSHLDTFAQALLLLGWIEEARPVVDKLLAEGRDDEDFLALCREHGLIAEAGRDAEAEELEAKVETAKARTEDSGGDVG